MEEEIKGETEEIKEIEEIEEQIKKEVEGRIPVGGGDQAEDD